MQNVASGNSDLEARLDRLREPAVKRLRELLGKMFDGADDALFKLSDGARGAQGEHFEAMRVLRIERRHIEESFVSEVGQPMSPRGEAGTLSTQVTEDDSQSILDELSLVDNDEMEKSIAIKNTAQRAQGMFKESIGDLETRLAWLGEKYDKPLNKTMFSPAIIAESFSHAMDPVELPIGSKLVVFKLFDQEVARKLGPMYAELNNLLIKEGVLPEIKPQVYIPRGGPRGPAAAAGAAMPTPVTEMGQGGQPMPPGGMPMPAGGMPPGAQPMPPGGLPPGAQPMPPGGWAQAGGQAGGGQAGPYDEASYAQAGYAGDYAGQQYEGDGADYYTPTVVQTLNTLSAQRPAQYQQHYYTPYDLANVLTSMQLAMAQARQPLLPAADIKASLVTQAQHGGGSDESKRVNAYDERIIDLVSGMFEFIFDDRQLIDSVKALLSRLQIPYIKVALLDAAFLRNRKHPARVLLNEVSQLSVGVTEESDTLFAKLKGIIERLVVEFESDITLFEEALEQLEAIRTQEEEGTQALETRVQHEAKRDANRLLARKMVVYEMKKRLGGSTLPDDLHPLVLKGWAPLMMRHYIQGGRRSPEWLESADRLGDLLACTRPITDRASADAFTRIGLDLPEVLRNGLCNLGLSEERIDEAMSPFGTYYLERQQELAAYELSLAEASPPPEPPPEESEDPAIQELENLANKLELLPSDVRPGVWYEIFTGEGSAVRRLKLLAVISETAQLVFVNRTGERVLDKDATTFAEELESGRSKPINDSNIFERALQSVITSMQQELDEHNAAAQGSG